MIAINFGTNQKWTSKVLRWLTDSQFTHVWFEYPSSRWQGNMVLHANPKGVLLEPAPQVRERYPTREGYICQVDLTPGLLIIKDHIGITGYDFHTAIWNGLVLLAYKATKWSWWHRILKRNPNRFTCSELATIVLKGSNVDGTKGLAPEFVLPSRLRKLCKESPQFLKY